MTADEVREVLKEVIDPEVGVNVVDLGLVYDVAIEPEGVRVLMTMTTPACPLGPHIAEDAQTRIRAHLPASHEVQIDITFEPPWDQSRMSEAAKTQLGWT